MFANSYLQRSGIAIGLLALILFGQNCSQVEFSNRASVGGNETLLSGDLNSDETPPASNTPVIDEPKEWLESACNIDALKSTPATFAYTPTGPDVNEQQKQNAELKINNAAHVRLQQMQLGSLRIEKAGSVEIQQIHADSIFVEALDVQKFQQLSARELYLKTAQISQGNLQQIGSNTKLHIEANLIDGNVQQLQALCLATHSVKAVQRIQNAYIVGRMLANEKAKIERVQQLKEVTIEDAHVGTVQQIQQVVLRNTHVDKIQQVNRLILINSTYGQLSSVGEVIQQ